MKHFIAIISVTFFLTFSFGQTAFKQNAIYIEAGGNGLFASANYELIKKKTPN
jgi:hypothetical protein